MILHNTFFFFYFLKIFFIFSPPPVFEERSDVGGGQARPVGRGEEVAEALLGEMAVLVVVEGLARQLAEEVAAVQGAAGAVVPLQGAARRREGLRAAAAAEAAEGQNAQQISAVIYDSWRQKKQKTKKTIPSSGTEGENSSTWLKLLNDLKVQYFFFFFFFRKPGI